MRIPLSGLSGSPKTAPLLVCAGMAIIKASVGFALIHWRQTPGSFDMSFDAILHNVHAAVNVILPQ